MNRVTTGDRAAFVVGAAGLVIEVSGVVADRMPVIMGGMAMVVAAFVAGLVLAVRSIR